MALSLAPIALGKDCAMKNVTDAFDRKVDLFWSRTPSFGYNDGNRLIV